MNISANRSILGGTGAIAAVLGAILLLFTPADKSLEYLVIHCSATKPGISVTADQIVAYHLRPVSKGGRGWTKPGYSDIIELDGRVVNTRRYNDDDIVQPDEITWGVKSINDRARHVCYVGGLDQTGKRAMDTRTPAQLKSLERYVKDFLSKHPDARVAGHYHFDNKGCPSFDVEAWLAAIGISPKNIYKRG